MTDDARPQTPFDDSPSEDKPWQTVAVEAASGLLASDATKGLSAAEAAARLAKVGPNTLTQAPGRGPWAILFAQFASLIVGLLVVATAISVVMGELLDAAAIFVVILINAAIGFFTEWRAEVALRALQDQAVQHAHVVRDGVEAEVEAATLVPGDLVVLATGDRVAADGRLVAAEGLQVEESALTGESEPVAKALGAIGDPAAALGDRLNLAFLGTTVTGGRGRMLVTATGARSEVGRIGALIDQVPHQPSPLQTQLAQLGRVLVLVVVTLCAVIVFVGWLRGVSDLWHLVGIGLSLAIAAVPEGLPAVSTMTLALGMQRMAKMKALVRRLPAAETLGSTTVICTDKTGTLTRNEMTVRAYAIGARRLEVTGGGYLVEGAVTQDGQPVDFVGDQPVALAVRIGLLCNDATIDRGAEAPKVLGDPTEAALVVVAEKAGFDLGWMAERYPRLREIPFDGATRRMATVHQTPEGKTVAFVKGSPGAIFDASTLIFGSGGAVVATDGDREGWRAANEELAGQALRVLGLAFRDLPDGYSDEDLGRDLTFAGLVGMSDPLRDEAKEAIARCREAGIRTVMITGDQPITAAEIARQLGIDKDKDGKALQVVHGRDLVGLDEAGWARIVADASVYARVSPEDKLQIVRALQAQGEIVAMTGDGVNDAPALKQSDIGVAMGIKGTEIAKENADLVITDDNFATIVAAVEEGRIIYANILRFLQYLLSCNLSEILVVFAALVIGWPLPLVALQVLWLNLITDVFPAFALALEPSAPGVMRRPPRNPKEALVTGPFALLIGVQGLLLTAVVLVAFGIGLQWYDVAGPDALKAQTIAFSTLAAAQVFHAFNARSQQASAFGPRVFTNRWLLGAAVLCLGLQLGAVYLPFLQVVLHTAPLAAVDWALVLGCALIPVVLVEAAKAVRRATGGGEKIVEAAEVGETSEEVAAAAA